LAGEVYFEPTGRAISRTVPGIPLEPAMTPPPREAAYRALFAEALNDGFVDDLRAATNGGWALGDARFKQKIAKRLRPRVTPLPRGRPPKAKAYQRQEGRVGGGLSFGRQQLVSIHAPA
jgi:hypothetical protein